MEHRGRRYPDQPGRDNGDAEENVLNDHVFIHTSLLATVNQLVCVFPFYLSSLLKSHMV